MIVSNSWMRSPGAASPNPCCNLLTPRGQPRAAFPVNSGASDRPMTLLLIFCYLATWAAIPHLLLLKKRPTATLAWLWAILFAPFIGFLCYLLFGTDRLKRRRLRRRHIFSAHAQRQGAADI